MAALPDSIFTLLLGGIPVVPMDRLSEALA